MKNNLELENQVLKILKYKNLFGQGLSKYQLVYFCPQRVLDINDIDFVLEKLIKQGQVELIEKKYYLTQNPNYLKLGFGKDVSSAKQTFDKIQPYIKLFSKINFINFIGVTGSLSSYFYNTNDDVDLFVIVKKNRVWTSRFLLVTFMKLLNVYVHQKQAKIKFCPNIYISDSSLGWDSSKRNIYSAHEIVMMQPLYSSGDVYLEFIKENMWINEYFPNFLFNHQESSKDHKENHLLNFIDSFLMKIQLLYMKKPTHLAELSKNKIHFLVHDHTGLILEQVKKF